MATQLAERVQRIKPSPTMAMSAKAKALKAEGRDVIDLGVGEPDFDTPEHIKAAAIKAIQDGFTKYTVVDGIPELKTAIIEKFERDNDLSYTPPQVLVSSGGKQSFFNLCQALLNDGDEVIIPAPYWVSYPDIAKLAGGIPVVIETDLDQAFKITPEQLTEKITDKTRLVILNSPSNPSGKAYSKAELAALAEVLVKYPHVLVATDDMYEHILWQDEPYENIVSVCPELYHRTMVLNGVSKAYAMTGWRIGYAAGPEKLVAAMKKVQSQSTSNPNSIAQVAAATAISGDQACIKDMLQAFKQRHDFVYKTLSEFSGFQCIPSDGTFYSFPCITECLQNHTQVSDDVAFAEHVLEQANVAIVPGTAFGSPGHFRLSYATGLDTLQEALIRLKQVI